MILTLCKTEIVNLVCKQLDALFVIYDSERKLIESVIEPVLERLEVCFSNSDNKYYHIDGESCFNPFHSGQYSIFLYFLSREVYLSNRDMESLADRLYYLNKALNGLDLYYEVCMPNIFHLDHPVGSVIGRANISDGFAFSQNCTVGNNKGIYPTLGKNVKMMSGAKILGDCIIGDNVVVSANAYIKDESIESGSVVFGSSPSLIVKKMP